MSKQKKGFGRAGLSGLATTSLVIGACAAFIAPANAAAPAPGDLSAESNPAVLQGANNQAAGNLDYHFANNFNTNSTVTFSVPANHCSTQAGIDAALGFGSDPTASVTRDDSATTGRIPTVSVKRVATDSTCASKGIYDEVVVTLNDPNSGGAAGDTFDLKLAGITYNVGTQKATGPVTVSATQDFGGTTSPDPANPANTITTYPAGTAVNAHVIDSTFMFVPKKGAQPNTDANPLGTATFTETSAGSYFPGGATTPVTLTISGGEVFTNGVVPTIQVPSGYTVYKDAAGTTTGTPAANGSPTYTFYVKAPATASKAVITVAGLQADTNGGTGTDTVTGAANGHTSDAVNALNVVNQTRTGGNDRYETAANLFNDNFQGNSDAVLSGGELFPDALSANYLAGQLNTGTLLTRANSLPDATKNAILNNNISTVYITGQTTAVSQAVEDQISSMHVGGRTFGPTIRVVRLGGENRYKTNAAINRSELPGGTNNTAVLAAGTAPYDSLSVGPVVYQDGYPLVLTNGSTLNNDEEGQFADLGVKNVVIVGGEAVISKAVQDKLVADGYKVIRISGPTRFDTSAQIATWATTGLDGNGDGKVDSNDPGLYTQAAGTLNSSQTDIANGTEFPDALSDGPVAGDNSYPLLLAQNASTPGSALVAYLGTKTVGSANDSKTIDTLHALGLNAAITNGLLNDAAAAIGPNS